MARSRPQPAAAHTSRVAASNSASRAGVSRVGTLWTILAQTRPEMLLGHGRLRGHAFCPIIVTFIYPALIACSRRTRAPRLLAALFRSVFSFFWRNTNVQYTVALRGFCLIGARPVWPLSLWGLCNIVYTHTTSAPTAFFAIAIRVVDNELLSLTKACACKAVFCY